MISGLRTTMVAMEMEETLEVELRGEMAEAEEVEEMVEVEEETTKALQEEVEVTIKDHQEEAVTKELLLAIVKMKDHKTSKAMLIKMQIAISRTGTRILKKKNNRTLFFKTTRI